MGTGLSKSRGQVPKGPAPVTLLKTCTHHSPLRKFSGRRRWAQVDLRRTVAPPDRCFLPDLTRFGGFRRTGPEPIFDGRRREFSRCQASGIRCQGLLSLPRCQNEKERASREESGNEIDIPERAGGKLRPRSDLVARRVDRRKEREPQQTGGHRPCQSVGERHAFLPARDRTNARTDWARSDGISSGFRSFSVFPVAR